ncbi:DNA (cytosine-5-)-methyltransferase [Mediterraneibacter sp. NSJ-55]|uniref:DNA (cytosine-5-)-methyltransferase n=2 Tax=Mediterraneibacter hominis TaxID=2763054 RepID=A0A923LHF1_9FIRM|nr:DNA (cytosine-5-)-methyltransferase [Mediterraneibacter hominis]MBC5688116.1 DNA (cytosine-5-)-methyltransferase [Mediterraneibacter hominis]
MRNGGGDNIYYSNSNKKKLKFIDFFAGIGGFRRGMELAGHECVGFCEWDKFATASYTSMHLITDEQREYLKTLPLKKRQKEILKEEYRNGEWYANDIRAVRVKDLPAVDCWCFGAPCFVKGTLITTHRGKIPIEEIQSGDMVLTHKNRWQRVIKPMVNVKRGIYTLKVQGSPITEVTGNHRFYVRDKIKTWNNELRKYEIKISDPYWKEVQKFDGNELIQFTVNNNNKNIYDLTEDECWILGRYVADGYLRDSKRNDRPSSDRRVIFCIGDGKEDEFKSRSKSFKMHISIGKSVTKYIIKDNRLFSLCLKCGRGAENKTIPQFIMDLDTDHLKYFLNGYLSGDGSYSCGVWKATTISKKLAYQLGECVSKVHHVGYSIYYTEKLKQHIIENRIVNQKDTWRIIFRPNSIKSLSYFIDGCLWQPVKNIEYNPKRKEIVYNMEVENDNSYTANNMGVHNCQDFSIAGKRAGLEGDRSSLIREIFRLLEEQKEENRPEWLIYENVKGMLSSNRGLDYLSILSELDRLGYDIEWQNIHSEWYVPQHRERIYTVGHLRRFGRAKILPVTGADGENSIRQIGMMESKRKNPNAYRVYDKDGISPALGTMQGGGREPSVGIKISEDFELPGNNYNQHKVVHGNGSISRTIIGCGHSGNEPKVAIPVLTPDRAEKRQNGRRFKENGEPMFTLTAQDRHGVAISPLGCLRTTRNEYGKKIRKDYESGKLKVSRHTFLEHEVRADGCSNTIDSVQKDNLFALKCDTHGDYGDGIYIQLPNGDICYAVWYEKYQCYIAIRRLTPRECFRLQGWTDDYFERAAFVNSDSQLYKQAGNGVTVPVVEIIGKKMSVPTENI